MLVQSSQSTALPEISSGCSWTLMNCDLFSNLSIAYNLISIWDKCFEFPSLAVAISLQMCYLFILQRYKTSSYPFSATSCQSAAADPPHFRILLSASSACQLITQQPSIKMMLNDERECRKVMVRIRAELTSFFQFVNAVTMIKMMVCKQIPPIIPPHTPCSQILLTFKDDQSNTTSTNLDLTNGPFGSNLVSLTYWLEAFNLGQVWFKVYHVRLSEVDLCYFWVKYASLQTMSSSKQENYIRWISAVTNVSPRVSNHGQAHLGLKISAKLP